MKNKSLVFIFICLTAGLFAQPFDGSGNFPPPSRNGGQSNRGLRPNRQAAQQEEKTLDSRRASDKLELKRPIYHRTLQQPTAKEDKKNIQSDIKPVPLPDPVSGPGNPLAPPPKIKYAPMPPGKKIFECSHCHYIYYTNYMPAIVKCEKPNFNHEWHLIGVKGSIWYRCIYCNTHVCSANPPLRSQCNLENKHAWEIVGQLTPAQQKKILEEDVD